MAHGVGLGRASVVAVCMSMTMLTEVFAMAAGTETKPIGLRCDSLIEPLGIDSTTPSLSWRLIDSRPGAVQTGYEITVSASPNGKADVWNSGRVNSPRSAGVPYGGPPLEPSHRYFWRVQVWDKDGRAYPISDVSWWETGLMDGGNWKGRWIGYEPDELHSLRNSGALWITNARVDGYSGNGNTRHDFRLRFSVAKPIAKASLYTTGQDATSAWVNGRQVRMAQPLPKWQQTPWGTYENQDVTVDMHEGSNTVAVEVTHFNVSSRLLGANDTQMPMSMCLYLVYKDGTTEVISSASAGWKARLNADGNWFASEFGDASWAVAEDFKPTDGGSGENRPGLPWPWGYHLYLSRDPI